MFDALENWDINLNILECKSIPRAANNKYRFNINLNILECK